ncbi:NUDIX hydrolase [Halioglobus sp. HI00S01]|uniref:NUDIX hydrolase n=1 Tax=Halioglobus sp. HI00S01 TaxID=1822214 RepID=UPI0007C3ECDE|nr:NUDIX hydrolase [Halioglobus sp. HI00S01]KZX53396.1 NUDIX hydrolase [Halioglobus sp. HI00S01]
MSDDHSWPPHVTVATVVEQDGRFLMVEEQDDLAGGLVFNQPAGHVDPGEKLLAAALRETLEETGWEVELTSVIGVSFATAPNGITYYRTSFAARPVRALENAVIDPDIHRVHWLSYEELLANSARMRSPLVLPTIERYRKGHLYPLDFVYIDEPQV